MQIQIPKDESHRVVELLVLLAGHFPEVSRELVQVARGAKHGISIEIEPIVPEQTDSQRGYYWKWVREFGRFCGTTPDETHEEILCQAYGSEYEQTRFGLKRRPQKRSSEANRAEYSLLIDTMIRVAAEMGFVVPPPQRFDPYH